MRVRRSQKVLFRGSLILLFTSLVICALVVCFLQGEAGQSSKKTGTLVELPGVTSQGQVEITPKEGSSQQDGDALDTEAQSVSPLESQRGIVADENSDTQQHTNNARDAKDQIKELFDPTTLTSYETTKTELGSLVTAQISDSLSTGMTSVLKKAQSTGKYSLSFADYIDLFGQTFSCVLQNTEDSHTYLMFARSDQENSTVITTVVLDASAQGFQQVFDPQEVGEFYAMYQ